MAHLQACMYHALGMLLTVFQVVCLALCVRGIIVSFHVRIRLAYSQWVYRSFRLAISQRKSALSNLSYNVGSLLFVQKDYHVVGEWVLQ